MRVKSLWIGLALIVALFELAPLSSARIVRVDILHTSDINGRLLPGKSRGVKKGGGLLRCATLIAREREKNPQAILLDSGAALRGTPESDVLNGSVIADAMKMLKYDACVPAATDFACGIEVLRNVHGEGGPEMLAANLKSLGDANPLPKLKPFIVRNVEGVRVAITGLTNSGTPQRIHPTLLRGLEWRSSRRALADIMPSLRALNADIHILVAHQGLKEFDDPDNEIRAIIKEFPEFDVIIGGNTGKRVQSVMIDDTLYTQAGKGGECLGVIKIEYDTVKDSLVARDARLVLTDNSIPQREDLLKLVAENLKRAGVLLKEPIGCAKSNFNFRPKDGEQGVRAILLSAIKEAVNADIVIQGTQSRQNIWEREQRERDLWRILPYEDRVGVVMLTFGDIKKILQENATYIKTNFFLGISGVDYRIDYDESGKPLIVDMRLSDGSVPHPRKRFKVALSSYVLASGGGKFKVVREVTAAPKARLELTDILIRDALREYMRRHNPLEAPPEDGLE